MTIYRFPKIVRLCREKNIKLHMSLAKVIVTQTNRMMLVSPIFGAGMYGTFVDFDPIEYGRFQPNKTFKALPINTAKQMIAELVAIEEQGLAAIKAISKLTGNCCVCGRTLTNEASIEEGIGPICADKVGGF